MDNSDIIQNFNVHQILDLGSFNFYGMVPSQANEIAS